MMITVDLHQIEYLSLDIAVYKNRQYYVQKFKNTSSIKKTITLLYESDIGYGYAYGWHYLLFPYIEGIVLSDLYEQTNFIEGVRSSIDILFQLLSYEHTYEKLYLLSDKNYITYDFSFHLLQGISLYRIKEHITQLQAMCSCLELIAPFIETHLDKDKQKWKSVNHFLERLELMNYELLSEMISDLKEIEKEYNERSKQKKKMNKLTKFKIFILLLLTIIVVGILIVHFIYHNYDAIQSLFPLVRMRI